MAEVIVTRHLVKPEGWADSPFSDAWHFDLEVIRRNAGVPGEAEEWSVSERGFEGAGFTATGKRVSLRGVDKLNRRHGVFDLDTALQLARDLVDGVIETRDYRNHADAAAQFLARSSEA